jgi:hypothetical protein
LRVKRVTTRGAHQSTSVEEDEGEIKWAILQADRRLSMKAWRPRSGGNYAGMAADGWRNQ